MYPWETLKYPRRPAKRENQAPVASEEGICAEERAMAALKAAAWAVFDHRGI